MLQKTILIFGGTFEGRQCSEYLCEKKIPHTVCVATEYGEEVLTRNPFVTVHQGRMDEKQMKDFLQNGKFGLVVDATHPYAAFVSANIRKACEEEKVSYLRYLRAGTQENVQAQRTDGEQQIRVNSVRQAADYLEKQSGGIFLTTGSKELSVFTQTLSDKSRIFARVLPTASVMEACHSLGLEGKQICAMQGPFSEEINYAMLCQNGARFLVTKDTGRAGGFPEKQRAARRAGVCMVVIQRPEDFGYGWEQVKAAMNAYLADGRKVWPELPEPQTNPGGIKPMENPEGQYNEPASCEKASYPENGTETEEKTRQRKKICCIGIGMGSLATLTHEAKDAILTSQILFGADRMIESVCQMFGWTEEKRGPVCIREYRAAAIADYLKTHPDYQKAGILMSGDVGFYSGARAIAQVFSGEEVTYLCGISSVVYFASRIPTAWQDARLLSAHGKKIALLNEVTRYPKLILIVSGAVDVEQICSELVQAGLTRTKVTVGSNLSYPEEKIQMGSPLDFLSCETRGLHILMIENPEASHIITPGIPDEAFVRGKVPMTKEEIRALSVAKLRLCEDSVVYDVGAGTGSVSVECARLCTQGAVYAVERNPEGTELIRENAEKFCLSNLYVTEGMAPEALRDLPVPTHAFIGGSSGTMKEIIGLLLAKNPSIRIVINTIALESITETMQILGDLKIEDADIVQIAAAKSRKLGHYHLMNALNPIYIISFGGR